MGSLSEPCMRQGNAWVFKSSKISKFGNPSAMSRPRLAGVTGTVLRKLSQGTRVRATSEEVTKKSASAEKAAKLAARMEKDMAQNEPKVQEPAFNRSAGRDRYNPQTYFELVADATQSVKDAIEDGVEQIEVELAALGQETYKYRADTFVDVNAALATALGAGLAGAGKRVRILLPDNAELQRQNLMLQKNMGKRMREEMQVLGDKLVFGCLTEARPTLDEKLGSAFTKMFNGGVDTTPAPPETPEDVFIVLNIGVLDLPLVETYYEKIAQGRTMILMNCELDTLRGDLGLPAFPSKDLHYRFLSRFKPVFFMRNRKYTKTTATPPYNIDYAGTLFREYPGPWQVMLKLGDGSLACVAESRKRFYLNEAKYKMAEALGIAETKGSVINFLRTGYKAGTWWEEGENQELHNEWRF